MTELDMLKNVEPDHYFHVANGTVIRGILEIDEAISQMSEDTFHYHVNPSKNDFANWIRNAVKDELLASLLEKINDKKETQTAVLRRIVDLFKKNMQL